MKVIFFVALAALPMSTYLSAHGRSPQMEQELNAPIPNWMTIGEPIPVEPAPAGTEETVIFRETSGESRSTRHTVTIPRTGYEIKVDYPINWYSGCSLSPDGTRLLINSGTDTKLYEILDMGGHREIALQLPHVTHDTGPKGFILGWSWADGETLVGSSEITDDSGLETLEKRIYVFQLKTRTLRRLNFSALNLPTTEHLKITRIGTDLRHLKVRIGEEEITLKDDLKSVPQSGGGLEVESREASSPGIPPEQEESGSPASDARKVHPDHPPLCIPDNSDHFTDPERLGGRTLEAKPAETAKIPTVSKPANPGLLPQVTLTAAEYEVDPFALNCGREHPPFKFEGGAGTGRVINRQGKVLLDSGKEIGIFGAAVAPDKEKVLVKGGNAINMVLYPSDGRKIMLPALPPGTNMLGFGDWQWLGRSLVSGTSGVAKISREGPHENCCNDNNIAATKFYTFDLLTEQLSEVVMPSTVTQPVVHAVEVMSDGHIHLVQDRLDGSGEQDLGWFKVEGSK